MDLSKIIIKGVRSNEIAEFIKSLEQLPLNITPGDFVIEAYQNLLTNGTTLHFVCDDKEEAERIKFNLPKNSEDVKREDYKVEFNYNDRHYELEKKVGWSP